jgi:hypothetical protein
MRVRALILALAVAALGAAALTGCSDNDSDTISLDDWVKKFEAVCQPATAEIEGLEVPASVQNVADPSELTEEQLADLNDYYAQIQDVYGPAVDSLADVGTPEEKADQAEEYLEIARTRQDNLQNAIDSAQSGDVQQFQKDAESLNQDDEREAELEKELGIDCSSSE